MLIHSQKYLLEKLCCTIICYNVQDIILHENGFKKCNTICHLCIHIQLSSNHLHCSVLDLCVIMWKMLLGYSEYIKLYHDSLFSSKNSKLYNLKPQNYEICWMYFDIYLTYYQLVITPLISSDFSYYRLELVSMLWICGSLHRYMKQPLSLV